MRKPVFIHLVETSERHGHTRRHQILTAGVLIREEGMIRLEYVIAPSSPEDVPLHASLMWAEPYWHVTRPSFGADLLTLCPDQLCQNVYSGEDGYLLDVYPAQLEWEEHENGGSAHVACRLSRQGRPWRSYDLTAKYTTLSQVPGDD